jgi:DNA-binding response OmpR family regulator
MAHILIIEPDNLLGASLKDYLKQADYSAAVYSDPQAALIAADRRPPDLVIAELQLAGRSGVEFLYEFRSYSDWYATPIILFTNLHPALITAYNDTLNDLGISACIYKTQAGLADLLRTVQQIVSRHAKV